VVAVGAAVQAQRADNNADPGIAEVTGPPEFVVGTPMLSVRRTPEWLRQPLADGLLESEVRAAELLEVTPPTTCIVVHRDGVVITDIRGNELLVPASDQKLVTAAAIFELAAPGDTFRTEVVRRSDAVIVPPAEGAEDQGSVLEGDLWLIGGGDPVLSTPEYISRYEEPRAYTDFIALADAVAAELGALGVNVVTGGIVADESRFPTERDYADQTAPVTEIDENGEPVEVEVEIWKDEFVDQNQAGPLSALLLNDGFTAWPEDPLARSQNERAREPAIAAAEALDALLGERGIDVRGSARNEVAPPPAERTALGVVESPSLTEIVARMLTHSDNTTAEMLLKEIGTRTGETGGRERAVIGMKDTLVEAGYPAGDAVLADGSGLSSVNRISCALLIDILDKAGPGSPIVEGLAVVGESGTVRDCFETRLDVGDLAVKTGTLNDVTALSGLTVADNDDVITFAMIANGEGIGATLQTCDLGEEVDNDIQVTLIDAVVGHPYGPALAELSPLTAIAG
jgi:D-alanyl-D-alanine carboxypeptidase/D-alanyl-D-alanine-endopeptidase (penicillin-binding protein 4)